MAWVGSRVLQRTVGYDCLSLPSLPGLSRAQHSSNVRDTMYVYAHVYGVICGLAH